ncbi:hypothetical protein SAMN05660484_01025 [Eubacterium ruminantium]|uniref:Acyl-coenzyme A:6-aminopenicillanic acid acyl-transferase n=2 Tax=Eubacterium ruminantium TaxID=42322 RepID=A0A1T4L721_9FIRM|nr:hypothetical protein SAMN05660484_01025 [Eubacterium ruminantium]SDM78942.1 hypothetical protein SAMN04490370_106103 [Eubacterium ruminantium]SJZ50512.1 hypothetical protein SAMN02745110_00705 [Eubacterium ruminantium]
MKGKNVCMKYKKSGNKIKKCLASLMIFSLAATSVMSLGGCGKKKKITNPNGMKKVGSLNVEEEVNYSDESTKERPGLCISSENELCKIDVYDSYYDVTLDYENGSPSEVGKAYAEAILKVMPDYDSMMESVLYENIKNSYDGRNVNYDDLKKRITTLIAAIPDEYRIEIESFAKAMSDGEEGYSENGKLSYIEILTFQIIPDALRPTACSALSLWGNKTKTGERITLRNLEWNMGSEDQLTRIHAVVHMKKGKESITSINVLGLLDILTAVNDDGVMIGILDVGSKLHSPFVYEGKKCYTFEVRYALEHFSTAKEAGEFLVGESGDFTWCNNLLVTDKKDAFCCENATAEVAVDGKAKSVLRSEDTEIMEGLSWDSKDSLCIVNTFASKGNQDRFTGEPFNINRWVKYNKWVSETDKFSVADVKGLMAREVVEQYEVDNIHNRGTVHTVILDYATCTIHVSFTKGSYADDVPNYIDVGTY